ncbi:putative tetratricopeptide-like helical domain superfamily [Dioscorea sansibarensis]
MAGSACLLSQRRHFEHSLSEHRHNPHHVKQLHSQILKFNLYDDPFVAPKLISSYSSCHLLPLAVNVFNQVQHPNALLFNTIIREYGNHSQHSDAVLAFLKMQEDGVFPDNFTFPFLLKACSGHSALSSVKMMHAQIVKLGFLSDIFVPNSLIDSYSKVGRCGLEFAKRVFDEMPERDVVSWNSLIAGLVRAGELMEAREVFDQMPERDIVSWNSMLDGYVKMGDMDKAFALFERMPERNVVSWCSLVSGYCENGDMDMARMLFDRMPTKNLVSWTVMISGYAERGLAGEAYCLFRQMKKAGLEADEAAIVSILAACTESGSIGFGKKVHAYVEGTELKFSIRVCNALVDMYAKCGNLDKAWGLFEGMAERNLVSWNSMIQGLVVNGLNEQALNLYSSMKNEGFTPDGVTFIGVLCACAHIGLIEEGRGFFESMENDYNITPQIEHYGCMIDLLGQGGLLEDAVDLLKSMPFESNAIMWGTLLCACRKHNNVELAEEVVEQLIQFEPSKTGNYAILSNIHASASRWVGLNKTRLKMLATENEFMKADRSHSHSERVLRIVHRLDQHLKQATHVP